MKDVDVKKAVAALYDGGKTTQTELAAELGCTQANVHYHLNNKAAHSRAPARLVKRIEAALERRNLPVPVVEPVGGR